MAYCDDPIVGTGLKLNVYLAPIDNYHLSDVDWMVRIYKSTLQGKDLVIKKSDATRIDDDNYYVYVDTSVCGSGRYLAEITAMIPDPVAPSGLRPEIKEYDTGILVRPRNKK